MERTYLNLDCMDAERGLPSFPDKYFDLAIVDPPYGIGASNDTRFGEKTKKAGSRRTSYDKKSWDDSIPNIEYFDQLFRVSKNQIIWGANYFGLIGGMLFWHKNQTGYSSSNGEIAFLSMQNKVDYVDILWHGAYQVDMTNKETRIHPTQKPIALYRWLLKNYAKEGMKLLDTHVGSASSLVAFEEMGFEYVAFEKDPDYYRDSCKRLEAHRKQQSLFTGQEIFKASGGQASLF